MLIGTPLVTAVQRWSCDLLGKINDATKKCRIYNNSLHVTISTKIVSALDIVGLRYEPMTRVPRERVAEVIFIVASHFLNGEHALLYHCDIEGERRTFIKGMRPLMGLSRFIFS